MPIEDTDLESLASERATESAFGSPLKDAIANLGRDENSGSEDDTEIEDSESEDLETEEKEEESEESSEESEGEEDAEEVSEEPEDKEAEKPKGKTPKLSDLEIPMPNADGSKGPRGTGKIKIEGLPQEAADAVRHYVKEAARLPLIEEQLNVAQEGAQIADFVEADPFSAMVLISNARPDQAAEFVRNYIAMNPDKIAEFTKELELEDLTDRERKLLAKDAKRDAEDRAKKSYADHSGTFQTQKQADKLLITVQDLANTANVSEDEMEEFMFVASRRVAKLFKQNPRITNREVVASLQPVVAKYAKTVTPTPKSKGAADPKTFKAKAQKHQKFKVLGSGKAAMNAAGGLKRPPKGTTTSQAIRMLAAGKL